jgi:S-DNA-T family DNA segregation ATPase FtsK/SpoIIIE
MAGGRIQASAGGGHGHLVREAEAIAGGALALFLALSLFSYSPDAPHSNLGGLVGHGLADTTLHALGVAAYLFPAYLVYFMATRLRRDTTDLGGLRLTGAALLVLTTAALAGLATQGRPVVRGGGWLGGFVGSALHDLLGGIGATLFLTVLLVVALVLATGVSAVDVGVRAGRWLGTTLRQGAARGGAAALRLLGRAPTTSVRTPQRPRRVTPPPVLLDDAIDDDGGDVDRPPIIREPERRPDAPKRERTRRNEDQADLFAPDKYRLPALSLLDPPVRTAQPIDEAALHASSRILQTKLADFGVAGKVLAVRPGPVITTFEFEPAPGVKVSRIVGLADDLAMALRAASVRILAPIPGKPVVGVEVSNPRREKVFISEMMQSDGYRTSSSKIALALGKDTTGNVVVDDLARMPHLLIAGATGTGKSVSMNAMIMSILYKATPRDVRLIMIDPKMLELSTYENIPHLLVPVVTDPKKAAAALNNMIREMDDRYRLLHDKGVRNVDSYNRVFAQAAPEEPADAAADDGADAPPAATTGTATAAPIRHRHLPRIVIIIDELADLMMTVGHEIEESITRLAQKARAAGIHLIIATQRPSVDVITGLIKANFPARVSFQVTTRVDSRTILDAIGAERLLGDGDMLFLPPGTARVQRLHGAFVSDDEVHKVVDFIKKQEQPQYQMELLEGGEEDDEGDDDLDEDLNDEQYDKAVRLVTEHQQASISWLQRRLRVGYNRAARMIERMEREGVVSAARGAGPREVLARRIED